MTDNFTKANFAQIKKNLNAGQIVILPTDTIAGFSVNPCQKEAIKSLQKIKKRQISKPFLLLVGNLKQMSQLVKLSDFAQEFIQNISPAPITFILPRQPNVLENFFPEQKTLAIRIPQHNLLLDFLNQSWRKPLVSTSINISGEPLIKDFSAFEEAGVKIFSKQNHKNQLSSSIVKITDEKIFILRDERLLKNKILSLANEILKKKK